MDEESIELVAKLKLDTTEADAQLKKLEAKKSGGVTEVALPKNSKIRLPEEATRGIKEVFSGPKGLLNIAKVAKSATNGFAGLGNSLANVANKVPKVAGIITLIIAVISALIKLLANTDTWKAFVESLSKLTDKVKKILAPALAIIGEVLIVIVDALEKFLPLLEGLADIVSLLVEPTVGISKALKPLLDIVNRILVPIQELGKLLIDMSLETFYRQVEMLAEVIEVISVLLEPLIVLLEVVADAIKTVFQAVARVLGFDGRKTWASTSGMQAGNYKTSLDVWQTTGDRVTKGDEEIIGAIDEETKELGGFKDFLKGFLQPIMESIEFIKPIIKFLGDTIAVLLPSSGTGFGGGLFNETGRWGNGYQFGDITGSIVDFALGLIGKGWLWADGGTLDVGAQIWGMNEQGNPEFLFNAGGHDSVINAEILEEALYKAVKRAGGTNGRIEVSVKEGTPAGPRELAQWLLPSLKFALHR